MPIYALEDIAPEFPADDQYWIAPTAVLIGRVQLMKNASVWFGAVLRGDNDLISIGENSNIQDNTVVHTDPGQPVTVGANVTVGHNVILHSASVGDNSLIGMGATLLNRSRVGKNCIVGANALITEGKEFGDGMLIVGSPARAIRPLGEAELALVKASAEVYVANYRRFRDGLG
ncbi:MAG: gamma carbonic anhydrase family protein [Rhizomicrobium sp.]|jgi:carbonic anhydrase/acetyltransferase-like protein (isoleucine patch superfamily)